MDFRVLGSVGISGGSGEIAIGAAKHRAVLGVLVLEANRAVPIERLIDLLWAERPPGRARNLVSGYVSKVRRTLESAGADRLGVRLETWRGCYRLVLPVELVDLYRFRRLVREAREGASVALLTEALALWTGPALADVSLPGLPPSVPESLEQERLAAFEELADARLRAGEDAEVLGELVAAVAAHPFRERLVGQLMLALTRCGRPADALATYRTTAEALRTELGISPGAPLRDLERAIRTDKAVAAQAQRPAKAPRPAQLPADLTDFTGRAEELAGLRTGDGPLLITGMPGVGKTALAVHWAHRVREEFPDGQLYVDLRDGLSPAEGLARLLTGLGVPARALPEREHDRAALYRSTVDGKRVLIVLDGAGCSAQVRPLLPGTATAQVIITSGNRLDGLALSHSVTTVRLSGFAEHESVRLIRSTIGDRRALREPAAVRKLAALCDGLPLAVRVAAVRLAAHPGWPVAHLAEDLADEDTRLAALVLHENEGHGSVPATLSAARERLPSPARELLALFALCPGPDLSAEALGVLADRPRSWVDRAISGLADLGLVTETAPGRYGLPALVRLSAKAFPPPREIAEAAFGRLALWRLRTLPSTMDSRAGNNSTVARLAPRRTAAAHR